MCLSRRWLNGLLGGWLIMVVTTGADAAGESSRIVLKPSQGKMVCMATVPWLDGQVFALGIPETIGCGHVLPSRRHNNILNFPEVDIRWRGPDDEGVVATTWTTDGRIRYTVRLVPSMDYVDVEMTIENLTDVPWRDVFAFNCVNPVKAPQFKDWDLERTYMSAHGKPLQMSQTKRIKGSMPTVGFYLHEQVAFNDASPFVHGFGATSPNRTDDSWIVTLSDPPGAYMGATSVDSLFLFDNLDRCCIHSAPNFGTIGPGQASTTVSRVYFAKGSLGDFINRFRADRAALEPKQRWAQAKGSHIELRGVDGLKGKGKGKLAFELRAPWMKKPLLMRLPETLHSAKRLLFIDHSRRDMPPVYKLEPFPQWRQDSATGEISYRHQTPGGLEFGGRARSYRDEVYVEFRVRNNSNEQMKDIAAPMCLSLAGSAEFGKQHDASPIYTWLEGRPTSLSETTPTSRQKGRPPWLRMRVSGAGRYGGPREHEDGWWFVDQLADHGAIARVSADGRHLLGLMWEDAVEIATNTSIPCLHSSPRWAPTLEPGQELVWWGKIYLMQNDLDALRTRCLGDAGRLSSEQIRQLATSSRRRGDAAASDAEPEVWLCHRNLHELVSEGAQWDFVRKHLDGIKLYIGALARGRSHILTDDELTRLVAMLNQSGLKLSIECGGTLGYVRVDENNGRKSAEIAMRAITKVHKAGGTVHYLDMDGPVRRLLATGSHRFDFGKQLEWQGFAEIQPCADQLMSFMATVRQEYPDIQCFALTNFPNWGYKGGLSYHGRYENRQDWGDYFDVVSTIVPQAKDAGLPLVAVTVDNPYDYAIGERASITLRQPAQVNWMQRIVDLERYVESQGLDFNLILNCEAGAKEPSERFCKDTLAYIAAYRAPGGSPKRYIVQTWMKHPDRVVPETEPYTLTWLAAEVIRRVKGVTE